MKYDMRTIIPAAGFGTRMNMEPNKSKELLPVNGRPMIEWTLQRSVNPLVITRADKHDLIDYCLQNKVQYLAIDESKEWPDSILKAKDGWGKRNVLLLPDTRFSYGDAIVERLFLSLQTNDVALGVFEVNDPEKWGVLHANTIWEKPQDLKRARAWGIIGFRNTQSILFENLLETGIHNLNEYSYSAQPIYGFKDLTRGENSDQNN